MFKLIPFLVDSIFFGFIAASLLLLLIPKKEVLGISTLKIITYNNSLALVRAVLIGALLMYQRSQNVAFDKWVILTIALEVLTPLLFVNKAFRNSAIMALIVCTSWLVSFVITAWQAGSFHMDLWWLLGKISTHAVLLALVYFGVIISKEESYK